MREPNPTFWRGRRVFVTGASGLLGSHMVRELIEMGAEVTALMRDMVPRSMLVHSGLVSKVNTVRGAITDGQLVHRILVEYQIQSVFHLAAQTQVTYAQADPIETFDVNIAGTYQVMDACRLYGSCTEIIAASSDKAYGQQKDLPYTEKSPLLGSYVYDASKSCTDIITRSYATAFGLPTAVTRLANLFGPGDLNFDRIVPGTARSVLRHEPIVIRSDGTPQREYIYVGDGVRAYLILSEDIQAKKLAGQAFNFGLGHPTTVLEVVAAIKKAAGKPDVPVQILGQAKGEIDAQWMDSSKAREQLGWEPRWSFEQGLEQTIPWYEEYLKTT
jgi:CDP-glucose 4,6-dehydratase